FTRRRPHCCPTTKVPRNVSRSFPKLVTCCHRAANFADRSPLLGVNLSGFHDGFTQGGGCVNGPAPGSVAEGYRRKSITEREDEHSLATQDRVIEAAAKSNQWPLRKHSVTDDG